MTWPGPSEPGGSNMNEDAEPGMVMYVPSLQIPLLASGLKT